MTESPDQADWSAIWTAMQELGAALVPFMALARPPSWAVSLDFIMEFALEAVEDEIEPEPQP